MNSFSRYCPVCLLTYRGPIVQQKAMSREIMCRSRLPGCRRPIRNLAGRARRFILGYGASAAADALSVSEPLFAPWRMSRRNDELRR